MSAYGYFTDEQKHRANNVSLSNFPKILKDRLIRSGHEKRLASDHSVTAPPQD